MPSPAPQCVCHTNGASLKELAVLFKLTLKGKVLVGASCAWAPQRHESPFHVYHFWTRYPAWLVLPTKNVEGSFHCARRSRTGLAFLWISLSVKKQPGYRLILPSSREEEVLFVEATDAPGKRGPSVCSAGGACDSLPLEIRSSRWRKVIVD